jgi:hypothetical protein
MFKECSSGIETPDVGEMKGRRLAKLSPYFTNIRASNTACILLETV